MIRATPDTNVIVSGLVYRRGKPYELLQRALSGEINLTVCQPILDEMADVLIRKFYALPDEVAEALQIMRYAARTVKPAVQLNVVKDDPDDDRVLDWRQGSAEVGLVRQHQDFECDGFSWKAGAEFFKRNLRPCRGYRRRERTRC